jgi:hypothetical protein
MSDTEAIDDKKETTTPTDPISESKTFFGALINQLFHLFIIIIAGGAMLWSARISQTNLMPTDISCEPYVPAKTDIKVVPINIDIVKTSGANGKPEVQSTKLEFPIEDNMNIIKFGILGLNSIRDWTDGPNSSPYTLYLGTIWQKMAANYSTMMNSFYNLLNQNCSESVIIFIMPYFITLVLIGVGCINGVYGMFLWFTQLYLLFSKQTDCFKEPMVESNGTPVTHDDGKPVFITRKVWEYKKGAMWGEWWMAFFYIFMAFIFSGLGSIIVFYFLVRSAFSSLFLPLMMVAKVKDSSSDESYSFSSVLSNIMKYKMSVIMYIISFLVVGDAYSALGSGGVLVAILACIFIYIFYPSIYQSYTPSDPTSTKSLSSYSQAHKFCSKKELEKSEDCEVKGPPTIFSFISSFLPEVETDKPPKSNTTPNTTPNTNQPSAPSDNSINKPTPTPLENTSSTPLENTSSTPANAQPVTPMKMVGGSKRKSQKNNKL